MFVSILDLVFPLYLKATLWCIKTLQAFWKWNARCCCCCFFFACDTWCITKKKPQLPVSCLFLSPIVDLDFWTISDLLCVSMFWAGTSQKVIRQLTCLLFTVKNDEQWDHHPSLPPLYLCFSYSQWWKVSEFNECLYSYLSTDTKTFSIVPNFVNCPTPTQKGY
jgi:hypothetical protein